MNRNKSNQIKIIIVEDELLVAEQIAEYLKANHYHVLGIFDNGEEVIEFLKQDSPDIILMDIELNGRMDGIETAAKVQESLYIPVIYLSKKSDDITLNRLKITLPTAYLTKPFKNRDVRNSIEMAIYRGETEHQKEAKHEIKLNLELDIKTNDGLKQLQNRIFYRDNNGSLRRLLLEELVYLEQTKDEVQAFTINGSFSIKSSLQKFLSKVQDRLIIRTHHHFAVNLYYMNQIEDQQIMMEFESGGSSAKSNKEHINIPLASEYKDDFFSFIENQII